MAVTDSAVASIKQLILGGELRPGDRLPAERALAVQLGVSRNSLREAVAALTEMGVLEARLGDGTYITQLDPAQLFDGLSFAVDLMRTAHLPNVLAVRRCLEGFATGLAATLITDGDVEELERLQHAIENPDMPVEERIRADLAFHAYITKTSQNPVLSGLLEAIRGTAIQASQLRGATDPEGMARTQIEHRMILDALGARDSGMAANLAASHVAGVENWIRRQAAEDAAPTPMS